MAVNTSTGAVAERYNYTPYGTPTVLDANFAVDADQISDIGNNHLYTGRERDADTGLQLNRHRYYASWLGRWTTRDPIGYEGADLNLYGYVVNKPINLTDPMGEYIVGEIDENGNLVPKRWPPPKPCSMWPDWLPWYSDPDPTDLVCPLAGIGGRGAKKAGEIIAKECKGSIKRVFPSEFLDKTLDEICRLAGLGDRKAKTAKKLLNDCRFKKSI